MKETYFVLIKIMMLIIVMVPMMLMTMMIIIVTCLQPSYAGSRRELGKLQFPPGESPCVSHMSLYAGSSLAECSAPPAPLARLPSLACSGLEVERRRDRYNDI